MLPRFFLSFLASLALRAAQRLALGLDPVAQRRGGVQFRVKVVQVVAESRHVFARLARVGHGALGRAHGLDHLLLRSLRHDVAVLRLHAVALAHVALALHVQPAGAVRAVTPTVSVVVRAARMRTVMAEACAGPVAVRASVLALVTRAHASGAMRAEGGLALRV